MEARRLIEKVELNNMTVEEVDRRDKSSFNRDFVFRVKSFLESPAISPNGDRSSRRHTQSAGNMVIRSPRQKRAGTNALQPAMTHTVGLDLDFSESKHGDVQKVLAAESDEERDMWVSQLVKIYDGLSDSDKEEGDSEADSEADTDTPLITDGTVSDGAISPRGRRSTHNKSLLKSSTRRRGSKHAKHRPSAQQLQAYGIEDLSKKHVNEGKSHLIVKKAVSKKKRRFVDGKFDLDLTYITDHIIAMGFPSESVEALYRNSLKETQEFFDRYHRDSFMIYNLCSERDYDHAKFDGRVESFPFDDHNCPSFDEMEPFCEKMDEWLCSDPKNVAALHCKAGKGRTGLMICVYLIHTGMWKKAEQALAFYAFARTYNQKGVTIPSQRRWVHYYERYVSLRDGGLFMPPSCPLIINKIYLSASAPQFHSFNVTCKFIDKRYTSKKLKAKFKKRQKDGGCVLNCGKSMVVLKDVRVEFCTYRLGMKSRVFSLWFSTDFIENDRLKLRKCEIDKVNKDKKMDDFWLEIFYEKHPRPQDFPGCEPVEESKSQSYSLTIGDGVEAKDDFMSEEELRALGEKMKEHVKVKNRSWRLQTFRMCFAGREAVTWMLREGIFRTRSDAIRAGQEMLELGIFHAVKTTANSHNRFENGPQFYRYHEHMRKDSLMADDGLLLDEYTSDKGT